MPINVFCTCVVVHGWSTVIVHRRDNTQNVVTIQVSLHQNRASQPMLTRVKSYDAEVGALNYPVDGMDADATAHNLY